MSRLLFGNVRQRKLPVIKKEKGPNYALFFCLTWCSILPIQDLELTKAIASGNNGDLKWEFNTGRIISLSWTFPRSPKWPRSSKHLLR
jgi:hypothetical protein